MYVPAIVALPLRAIGLIGILLFIAAAVIWYCGVAFVNAVAETDF